MLFDIDLSRYKLVDLSWQVVPNQTVPDRPFAVREGRLGDGTWKFDIVDTHTHVGTHVESPWHFYGSGKTCTDYPLEKFMGRAVAIAPKPSDGDWVRLDDLRPKLDARKGTFKVLFIRNATALRPLRIDMACVPYLAQLGINLFVFDVTIAFGDTHEDGRTFHDVLMSRDILLVEFPDNGAALDREEFYLFAVPLKIKGLDSSACRLFAVVER